MKDAPYVISACVQTNEKSNKLKFYF